MMNVTNKEDSSCKQTNPPKLEGSTEDFCEVCGFCEISVSNLKQLKF